MFPQMSVHDVRFHALYVHFHAFVYFNLCKIKTLNQEDEKTLCTLMCLEQVVQLLDNCKLRHIQDINFTKVL